MRLLLTAGPTHEPIDPVRYIGNRSSGRMGAAIAASARSRGIDVTLIVGPGVVAMPTGLSRIDVVTAADMHAAVFEHFPTSDLLIMAAAVADFRPRFIHADKLSRSGALTIECEPTADILADAVRRKTATQRVVGFSLETGGINRAIEKMRRKGVDLMVYNPAETMNADNVAATVLWPDGRREAIDSRSKAAFADKLLDYALAL